MRIKYVLAAFGCLAMVGGLAACGGNDEEDSSGSAGELCAQFCPVAVDLSCPGYTDVDTCTSSCNQLMAMAPAECEPQILDFADCMSSAPDVECGTALIPLHADSCQTEETAAFTCATGGGGN